MIENLENFVGGIENFDALSTDKKCDYFMYYKIEYEKMKHVSPEDVKQCFKHLKIPAPTYADINKHFATGCMIKTRHYMDGRPKEELEPQIIQDGRDLYLLSRLYTKELKATINEDKQHVEVEKTLQSLIPLLTNEYEKEFLRETILCFEVKAYRGAIVMMWTLVMQHLYQYILADTQRLQTFNGQLTAKEQMSDIQHFDRIAEWRTIDCCNRARIISKNVYNILDSKLTVRNTVAHASKVSTPFSKAHDFIIDLVDNVITVLV